MPNCERATMPDRDGDELRERVHDRAGGEVRDPVHDQVRREVLVRLGKCKISVSCKSQNCDFTVT
jgi:hypothetical protein